jgi:hypothetical protein
MADTAASLSYRFLVSFGLLAASLGQRRADFVEVVGERHLLASRTQGCASRGRDANSCPREPVLWSLKRLCLVNWMCVRQREFRYSRS